MEAIREVSLNWQKTMKARFCANIEMGQNWMFGVHGKQPRMML
jgi:hypothetical protein